MIDNVSGIFIPSQRLDAGAPLQVGRHRLHQRPSVQDRLFAQSNNTHLYNALLNFIHSISTKAANEVYLQLMKFDGFSSNTNMGTF